jgi:hypothetical protein
VKSRAYRDVERDGAVNSPLYDVVLALHVTVALAGFGALAFTGWYAAELRRGAGPEATERLRRYFRPGVNWAGRALLLVPLFGGILLALGHGQDVGQPFPWIGLAIWLAATAIASARVWPGERSIQHALAAGEALVPPEPGSVPVSPAPAPTASAIGPDLAAVCRQVERAAAATSVLFVVALAVMIIQPG